MARLIILDSDPLYVEMLKIYREKQNDNRVKEIEQHNEYSDPNDRSKDTDR